VAAAIDTAGLPPLRELTGTDPLTLLPGHRALHEAIQQALEANEITVAVVQLEELAAINRDAGYAAGDRALLIASRATQLAAARVGGTVYRDSGRRLVVMVKGTPTGATHDLADELHTEFAIGPRVSVGITTGRPGEAAPDVLARARDALPEPPAGPPQTLGSGT
jgi:GGDEF domain-containing protein